MNFQQLETLQWVVQLGSFTKAAVKLNATQSTISMRISDLEQELDVQLLDRSQRKIHATAKGRDLLVYADEIYRLKTEIKTNVGNPEKMSGSIRLGVAELIALTWMPQLVADLNRVYPNIEIDLEIGLRGDSYERLLSRDIDLCFLPLEKHPGTGLETEDLHDAKFVYMASPTLNLHGRLLSPADVGKCAVVMLGPNSVIADIQNNWFRDNGIQPIKVSRSNSMEISAGLVRSGLGISFLPQGFYSQDIKAGKMVVLDIERLPPPVKFYVISAANNKSPIIRTIIDIARRHCHINLR